MIMKSFKFWQSWFRRDEQEANTPERTPDDVATRKPPATITVRAAMRQKQKLSRATQ